jgi:UDP-N-acetylmuramyl pentapeptide phosphotransferase/UDP-N-acetylglucosamine-1-phosphate transferase
MMSGRTVRGLGRLALVAAGGAAARTAVDVARSAPWAASLERTNYRGHSVSLSAGPALTAAASAVAGLGAVVHARPRLAGACLVAGLGAGAVGLYDDVVGARPQHKGAKGFHGHLGALREGRITSGLVKVAGVGAAGLAAAALLPSPAGRRRLPQLRRVVDVVLGAGVIAGAANLVNLLDLRPGRALKATLAVGAPLAALPAGHGWRGDAPAAAAAGALGAAAATLPADLDEQVMIGDCGANALGALLGLCLAARLGPLGRGAVLLGLAGLTAASERISFTAIIEGTPGLRDLDRLGRRP